jgi:YVTN family beta-propeller protein
MSQKRNQDESALSIVYLAVFGRNFVMTGMRFYPFKVLSTGLRKVACPFIILLCCSVFSMELQAVERLQGARKTAQETGAKARKTSAGGPAKESSSANQATASPQRVVHQGIAVDLNVEPVTSRKKGSAEPRAGDEVTIQFTITYTATGTPLTGIHPVAWMDLQRQGENADCRTKVKAFLDQSLLARPTLDLNNYYVLALNQDATVSVIDPRYGYGGSRLLALVSLKSPGEDWALTPDGKKLFVSMPDANQVAIVESQTWKVITNVNAGLRPARLAAQPDGQNVWVAYGEAANSGTDSGVAVIATEGLQVIAQIPTGRGHHEIAFSDDSRFAFVTNADEGTVSVIDIRGLKKLKDLETGRKPSSIAFCKKARMAYVVHDTDGAIAAIDGASLKLIASIQAAPGLRQIKFAPDGRFGFIANPTKNLVHIIDSATNRIVQTAEIEDGPDQISFSNTYAYVRSQRSEIVHMIRLSQAGAQGQALALLDFPGGQQALGKASRPSPADSIVRVPEEGMVLVANAADQSIYYYQEGMAAPMGSFSNYKREPRAVIAVDRSLQEGSPGVYQTTAKLHQAGLYNLAFLMNSPRIVHCFAVRVEPNLEVAAVKDSGAVRIEPLIKNRIVRVGEKIRLQFKLVDPETKKPKFGLRDLGALIFLAPGIWQNRPGAKEVEKGIYEIEFQPPQSGVYYVYLEAPSLGLKMDNPQYLILQARDGQSQ